MGATTVIYKQKDPTAEAISEAGNSIAGTLQQQQALKLTGQYYKIMAKNAETESQKAHLDRLSQLTSNFLPQIAAAQDPATKAMLIKAVTDSGLYGGDHQQFFSDLGEVQSQVQQNHQAVAGQNQQQPAPQSMAQGMQQMQGGQYATPGQLSAAQAQEMQSRAGLNAITADYLRNPGKYMSLMNGGQGDAPGTGGQPTQGGIPNVQDVANQGPVAAGFSVNAGPLSVQYTNPHAKTLEAMAGVAGNTYAEKQFALAPFKQTLSDLKSNLNAAIQEQGGPAASEVEGGIKGFGGKFLGEVKPNSAISGFDDSLNVAANGLTSEINRGRPNTVELAGVKDAMPNRYHSAVTNAILFRRLENMTVMPGQQPEAWATMLQQNKVLARNDDAVIQNLRRQYPNITDAQINKALRRIHQERGDL